MAAHFEHIVRLGTESGPAARAEADIDAWGPALPPAARRKMIALQLANAYWMDLEESLGTELDPPVSTRFAELTVPVDVVVGSRDFEGTRRWARRLAAQAPSATYTEIPGGDHFPMLSTPEPFACLVRAALLSAAP